MYGCACGPVEGVICRIGSLEIVEADKSESVSVICRIGSLEINLREPDDCLLVICRIGSLENIDLGEKR